MARGNTISQRKREGLSVLSEMARGNAISQRKREGLSVLSEMARGNAISQRKSRQIKRKYDFKIQHDITNAMEKNQTGNPNQSSNS